MSERRPHKRYKIDLLDVTSAMIQTSEAEIINISLGGIALRANRRLNMGEKYTLRIKSKDTGLNLKGIVIWSQISNIRKGPGGNTVPVYTAGIEFVDASDHKRNEIINFIETHKKEECVVDVKQLDNLRLYTRVQVYDPEKAFIIDQTESHKVKQLSFSGAQIECKHPMKVNNSIPMMISFTEDKFIVFHGMIASCRLIRNAYPKAYEIGIEFSKMAEREREILAEFIRLLDAIDKSPQE
jgi:c-di-GMP-binding flagellar brake protein YcgR